MKIGVDLDEVLGHFLPALIDWHNDTYETSWAIGQFYTYHFWEIWGGTVEESIQKVYDFHKTPYFKNIRPVKGSKESLASLKKDHELFIITSRQNDIKQETEEWVEQHFPGMFSEIHFTNNFSQSGAGRTKKEIADKLDIDIMIEDSAKYALECLSPGRKIFLIDYPWNKNEKLPEGIIRVNSWEEILENL